jgi:hypothetical protein
MVQEPDIFVSIQTWEDKGLIRVGFEVGTECQRTREPLCFSREDLHQVLLKEEQQATHPTSDMSIELNRRLHNVLANKNLETSGAIGLTWR